MIAKPTNRVVGNVKTIKAKQTNAERSLARRGEFTILWVIVAVVSIALALILIFYVFHGAMPSLGASNTLTVSAEEMGGVLVMNVKAMGVSAITVEAINLVPSGSSASSCTAYLNGNSYSGITSLPASGLSITLNPGDTLSITCSSLSGSPTQVEVVTTSGAYTAPIS
ncbi:hypothetical protein B7L70_07200 [Vulcanisaeta sp. EB80]|uniref:hypothetical protein n=1 Tax=Vulcanisaeta sp. EB80 TaxID=1650660 RepID=UPI0009BCD8C4|nr:hypothetical protein [Vulcanisaeta sp. EB80]PLC67735.1 hypothetical protein B7L70_07200 [Vulcanisaeta sp. EB80]